MTQSEILEIENAAYKILTLNAMKRDQILSVIENLKRRVESLPVGVAIPCDE